MSSFPKNLAAIIRFTFEFVLFTLLALLGPAFAEFTILRLPYISPWSSTAFELFISIGFGGMLGFFSYREYLRRSTQFTWLLPALWFLLGVMVYRANTLDSGTVTHFLGLNSSVISRRDFVLFSVPLIRTTSFSCAALLTRLYLRDSPKPVESQDIF